MASGVALVGRAMPRRRRRQPRARRRPPRGPGHRMPAPCASRVAAGDCVRAPVRPLPSPRWPRSPCARGGEREGGGDAADTRHERALLAAALGLVVGAVTAAPYDAGSPRPDSLLYAIDDDGGHAWWLSVDPAPNAWTWGARAGGRPGRVEAELFPRPPQASLLQTPAPLGASPRPPGHPVRRRRGRSAALRGHVTMTPETEARRDPGAGGVARCRAAKVQGRRLSRRAATWD